VVGSWIAAVLILILLVGGGCYLAGWVGHSAYQREYEAQRHAHRALAPVGGVGLPVVGAAPPPNPVVITVYLTTPGQLSHLSNGVVIGAHIPPPLPASGHQRWAVVVDPTREGP
jgi:hypothetical protein